MGARRRRDADPNQSVNGASPIAIPALLAEIVVRDIHRNAIQPGLEHVSVSEFLKRRVNADENCARKIRGLFGRYDSGHRARDSRTVGVYDFLKRFGVARPSLMDLLRIGQHLVHYSINPFK